MRFTTNSRTPLFQTGSGFDGSSSGGLLWIHDP
jgi:hypothetical protein